MNVVGSAVVRTIPEPVQPRDRKARRMQSDAAILAVLATRELLQSIGWTDPSDVGQFMGVGASGGRPQDLARLLEHGLRGASPLLAFQLMNNFAMCHAAIDCSLGGPNRAVFSKGAGTVFALVQALASGAERMIVGGTDCGTDPVTRHNRMQAGYDGPLEDAAAVIAVGPGAGPAVVEARFIGRSDPPAFDADWVGLRQGDLLAADAALGWIEALEAIEAGAERATAVIRDRDGQCGWVTFGTASPVQVGRGVAAPGRSLGVVGRRWTGWPIRVDGDGERAGRRHCTRGAEIVRCPRPVSVRSMGVLSPYGVGRAALRDGLRAGVVATSTVDRFDTAGLEASVAAQVPRHARVDAQRDRKIGMAVEAARQLEGVRADAWIHLGVGLEAAHLEDFIGMVQSGAIDWSLAPDRIAFRTELDAAAWALANALSTTGPVTLDVSACAAGGLSLLTAKHILDQGLADQVVCGAVDAMINPLGFGGMARLGAMSSDGKARPFDRRRNGLVMGEGCALFLLERGTGGLGTLLGGGSSQDGYRVTAPRPDGSRAAIAITRALEEAGLESVQWVNAHGTGTPLNDPAERAALDLAEVGAPVRSMKGAIGHGMAASGALEAAATWLCLEAGFVPKTAGLSELDPLCVGPELPGTEGTVLSNSFGFGGQNVALILGRP